MEIVGSFQQPYQYAVRSTQWAGTCLSEAWRSSLLLCPSQSNVSDICTGIDRYLVIILMNSLDNRDGDLFSIGSIFFYTCLKPLWTGLMYYPYSINTILSIDTVFIEPYYQIYTDCVAASPLPNGLTVTSFGGIQGQVLTLFFLVILVFISFFSSKIQHFLCFEHCTSPSCTQFKLYSIQSPVYSIRLRLLVLILFHTLLLSFLFRRIHFVSHRNQWHSLSVLSLFRYKWIDHRTTVFLLEWRIIGPCSFWFV